MTPTAGLRIATAVARAALVAAAVVAVPAGSASARSIEIEDFAVDVQVNESSDLDLTETIRLRFHGSWNGIIRNIPIQNVTSRGERRNLGFRLESVADEAGRPFEVTRSRRGADVDLKIRVPGAADAVRTVVIRYRIAGGLRFFDDHDELYWNLTGDEWTFPIHAARARIVLPGDLVNVRVNAFTGRHGSMERAVRISVDGVVQGPDDAFVPAGESPPPPDGMHVVEIEATRPLGIREGLTAAVAWNPGVVRRPSPLARWLISLGSWFVGRSLVAAVLLAPLATFIGMFWRWRLVGRDPRSGPLVVEYAPPDGLGPAETGTLFDNKADIRDLMAGLVDAAVKGVVRIRESVEKSWFRKPRYFFDLLVPESFWDRAGITASSQAMLRGMFYTTNGPTRDDGAISTVSSYELQDSFYKHLPGIKDSIFTNLVERGFYRTRPDTSKTSYVIGGLVGGIAVSLLGLFVLSRSGLGEDGAAWVVSVLVGLATFLIVAFFARIMPARTITGARTRDKIRGFEEFLSRVEKHRLEAMPLTPELFEKFLPYAIALGVQRRWAAAFADICTQPPTWYVGSSPDTMFDAGDFTYQLGSMTNSTASAMTSAPRSSGDSGFGSSSFGGGDFGGGGGGFSGGGDGGGGGSGW